MAKANMTVHGGSPQLPTLLGQGPARIPVGGKIRAGTKVLTSKAAEQPRVKALYDEGVAAGQSFDQIERAIRTAVPGLKTPLIPRNVPWFTVRAQDFSNPALAQQIMQAYGEDRGEGHHLYRFPVVFPADQWQSVMPHELAAWSTHEKLFWSEYSADGRTRHCMRRAPVPVDDTGRRTIRIFGGRKVVQRDLNGGICEPEACREYQAGQCNLTGRFVFFIPGIRSVSAFELNTNSFYAMNAAIQKFETVGFLRGGRISGFLDRQNTTFFLSKKLMDVPHIDDNGRAVRVPQWIIDLEAPVDVTALLRHSEDEHTTIVEAEFANRVLEGDTAEVVNNVKEAAAPEVLEAEPVQGQPSLEHLLTRARSYGIEEAQYQSYADSRWGRGWRINPQGRRRAWEELERYRNDPEGYRDKIEHELRAAS